jgi:type I restriction enzyme, S subunit
MGTGQPNVNGTSLSSLLVPLPPIAEQSRIVVRVEELMKLCDALEENGRLEAEQHARLVSTLFDTLAASESPQALTQNWQRIAQHFDLLLDRPEAVDALERTVLELAVMGRLSSPEESDGNIDELLAAILIERKNFGMTKQEEASFAAELADAKLRITNNRVVLKASFFCGFITKGTTPSSTELLAKGDIPFLKVYNIVNNHVDFAYKPTFVSNSVHQTKLKRSVIYPGDVIMNIVGPPLGKVAIVRDDYPEWNMNQALAVFRPLGGVLNSYIYYMLSTTSVLKSVLSEVKGTAGQDNLSLQQCRDLLVPIPAIEEQHRIVARVKELRELCAQLRERLTSKSNTQARLAEAIVSTVVSPTE